ncbi:YybH family protein [Ensifer adhaerens]|uniref:YybH family protein n=1 Tax=Ensifer adhaerens TaxID=106592 RepID=UPI000CF0DF9B|nr:SgcJ/EcaC family oxidoreductase [Ensifer adhaerens]
MRSFPYAKLATVGLSVLSLLAFTGSAHARDTEAPAIERQLREYQAALNASDVDAIMNLYAADAVFMPQNSPPAVGRDAIKGAYQRVFAMIDLDVRFEVDEIRALSRDWVYARTRSNGTVKVLSTGGAAMPEANQELFLFHREKDGIWRFARYIFATTNPPPQR